ncbi:MAG: DUF6371 domain-containing protein [Bacteroidales bacterium]|nr:DUF6371 domain-containing protein [Bacteroidales bacterium]
MNEYQYILEKGSKKYNCPECSKKTFVRYIDTETGDYLPDQYGRCDRESKCTYHLNPYEDEYVKMIWKQEQGQYSKNLKPYKPNVKYKPEPVFIPVEVFKQTLSGYEKNIFIQNLVNHIKYPFEILDIEKVISLYNLGTVQNGYRTGAITFPFIDKNNNIRTIQVKQFDKTNHTNGTDFLHSIIEKHHQKKNERLPDWFEAYQNNEIKVSCLFGEHLLSKYPYNPVALVEAPKTAVYGTLYFGLPETPETLIWLAVYNKSSFSFDKLKVLQGKDVFTFPDLSKDGNTFKEWETKAKEYESRLPGTRFIFSDLLEQLAPGRDKSEGNDLADYLIKQDWRLFRKHNIQEQPQPEPEKVTGVTKVTHQQNILFSHVEPLPKVEVFKTERIEHPIKEQPQNWSNDITELETYFANIALPTEPVKLNKCSTVTDCSLFIKSHFATLKGNNGKRTFLPYLNRLQELKQILTINSN